MRTKIIIALFFFTLFLSGCSSPIKNLNSEGQDIICFGNSITEGAGVAEENSYPKILETLIGKTIISAGVSGDTTGSALNRLERDVLTKDPFLVIVELGGNDFLLKRPKEETLQNLEEIISKIHQKGSIVALCDMSYGWEFSLYGKEYKKLAKKTGSILIPHLLGGVLNDPTSKLDNIHPNEKGHKIIAQKIYAELKKYLK